MTAAGGLRWRLLPYVLPHNSWCWKHTRQQCSQTSRPDGGSGQKHLWLADGVIDGLLQFCTGVFCRLAAAAAAAAAANRFRWLADSVCCWFMACWLATATAICIMTQKCAQLMQREMTLTTLYKSLRSLL